MSGKSFAWLHNSRGRIEFLHHGGGTSYGIRDLKALRTSKMLNSPTGGWSATLLPSENFADKIKPSDWVKIYLAPGDGNIRERQIMIGLVDDVVETRAMTPDGGEDVLVTVTGRDWGKIVLGTTLVFDQYVGEHFERSLLNIEAIRWASEESATKSPGTIVKNLLTKYLADQRQFVHPHSGSTPGTYLNMARINEGLAGRAPAHNFNVTGTLYHLLKHYSNEPLNELWFDTTESTTPFTAVLREHPFGDNAFRSLKAHAVLASECTVHRLMKTEQYIFNWFRLHSEFGPGNENPTVALRLGSMLSGSIQRHGLRRHEQFTQYTYPGDLAEAVHIQLVKEWTEKIAAWNGRNEDLWWGSLTMRLRPDIKIGNRIVYAHSHAGRTYDFYVLGVEHTYNYPGVSTTTVHVGRGVRRASSGMLLTYADMQKQGLVSDISETPMDVLR